jgi:hypothetical protein
MDQKGQMGSDGTQRLDEANGDDGSGHIDTYPEILKILIPWKF